MAGAEKVFDIVIVGAGVSGINCAYRIQTQLPQLSYVILEERNGIGGTWDLFKFPGVRSDADLYTYGFEWNKWPFAHPIAEGSLIMWYLNDTTSKFSIKEHIRFRHRVQSAAWSSKSRQWSFVVDNNGQTECYGSRWFIMASGYFDYETPRKTDIPGLNNFRGKVIHPQFWPTDYNYHSKKIAIIGSGATAITLLPNLAKKAAEVTMVQRSPTYILAVKNSDRDPSKISRYLPLSIAGIYERLWFLIIPYLFILFYKFWPTRAQDMLYKQARDRLPGFVDANTHFRPRYNPCDQRICISPEGDFYDSFHRNGKVVSGCIENITSNKIHMKGGQAVDADVIVTATGLQMRFGGGIRIQVDEEQVEWPNRLMWNRAMIEGVPNMIFMIGYTTSAWTLGVDNSAFYLCRLLRYMKYHGVSTAIPQCLKDDKMAVSGIFQLRSTYVIEGNKKMPVYGSMGPWRPRIHPPLDWAAARWGDYTTGLRFS